MLPRGTTPEVPFKFRKIHVEDITDCILSIYQSDTKMVERDLTSAVSIDPLTQRIIWRLTQEETLQFNEDLPVEVQIKYKTDTGEVYTSKDHIVKSYKDLYGKVL